MPPRPFFAGPGLDRADPLRADPDRIAQLADSLDARQLAWSNGLPAIADGRLQWQPVAQPSLFLGLADGAPRFSAIEQAHCDAPSAFHRVAELSAEEAPLFAAALSLSGWHRRHRFCSNCGEISEVIRGGWSRRCTSCSAEHYPRVDPVVIMLAEHDGDLLLGRQPHYPPGRYSALAGFVEVGETVEDAVARELREEAGIEVFGVTYVASQPWPFPSSLMIGCTAQARSRELLVDTAELDDARWFSREQVAKALAGGENPPFLPPPHWAIARTLLAHWLAA